MPYIKRKEIQPTKVKYKHEDKSALYYSSEAWIKFREIYTKEHPLCAFCLEHERIEPTTCLHHATPFLRGESEEERWNLFLDPKNIIPLCSKCHTAVHVKDRMYHLGRLDSLTDKEYNYAHGIIK